MTPATRTLAIALVALGVLLPGRRDAHAQGVLASPQPLAQGRFGNSVAGLRDVTGDRRDEIIVGAPSEKNWNTPDRAGRVYVFSGATQTLIHALSSPDPQESGNFGAAVAAAGDLNGDGWEDLAVGAPGESLSTADGREGRVYLFNGRTGILLRALISPTPDTDGAFGVSLSRAPAGVGGGAGALLVGTEESPGGVPRAGRAHLFDGATGALLRSHTSPFPTENSLFGSSLCVTGDLDSDGLPELIIAANERYDESTAIGGVVYVFSRNSAAPIAELHPPAAGWNFHASSLSRLPDVTGDGIDDVLIGAPSSPSQGGVVVFDGSTGAPLYFRHSPTPWWSWTQFGGAVCGVDDLDGDGRGDFAVGEPVSGVIYGPPQPVPPPACVHYFSGRDGSHLTMRRSVTSSGSVSFGSVLASADVNGDGRLDFIVGDARESASGRVHLVDVVPHLSFGSIMSPSPAASGAFGGALASLGDIDGDGRGDLAVGAFGEAAGASLVGVGRVHLVSGATRSVIRSIDPPPPISGERLGAALASYTIPSGHGSGSEGATTVVVATALSNSTAGDDPNRLHVFDVATGELLHSIDPPPAENSPFPNTFSPALAVAPDVDGDGCDDIVVGAYGFAQRGVAVRPGRVHVYSGASARYLRTLEQPGETPSVSFSQVVAGLGGSTEGASGRIVVAGTAPQSSSSLANHVYVFAGDTGELLLSVAPEESASHASVGALARVPDALRPGRDALAVGYPNAPSLGSGTALGRVFLLDPDTGAPVYAIANPSVESGISRFGVAIAPVPDVNADGRTDLVVGVSESQGAGRAYVLNGPSGAVIRDVSSPLLPPPFVHLAFGMDLCGLADVDGDGLGDVAIGDVLASTWSVPAPSGRAYLFRGSLFTPRTTGVWVR